MSATKRQLLAPEGGSIIEWDRPRHVTDWLEDGRPVKGHEAGGLALPPMVLAAIATARVSGQPCEYVVTGEERHPGGRWYLTFAASRDHIEAVSDFRHQDGGLHYHCPDCHQWRGKHATGCARKTA